MAIVSPCPDLTRQALRAGKPLDGRLAPIGAWPGRAALALFCC